jgi:DNA-binding MarR family transcriptional regulator
MNFEEAHEAWVRHHLQRRTGERKGRLERGHGHGEKLFAQNVWWPLFGQFDQLHPEYEVPDWRGRSYFADFAWLPGHVKLLFEVKGYGPHVRDMDRLKYCAELNRETFLHGAGFSILSFAYDDVEQRAELCVSLLRMALSRYLPERGPVSRALLAEKEIIRLALQLARPIRPIDVIEHFGIDRKTAIRILRKLCEKGFLHPLTGKNGERSVRYELASFSVDSL